MLKGTPPENLALALGYVFTYILLPPGEKTLATSSEVPILIYHDLALQQDSSLHALIQNENIKS